MSWELMGTNKKSCQCGKGFVVEKHYMDDWNRTKVESTLECKDCRDKQLKENNKYNEILNACTSLKTYFNERYLDQWIEYFKEVKNKKAIWELVHSMKMENCSLTTFYSRQRSLSISEMNEYYKSLVQIQYIPQIIQVLNIKDEVIESALPQLLRFYEEQERKRYNEAYAYYRKKI